jgi:hypothetical protein
VSPEQKLLNARQQVDQLRLEVDALAAKVKNLQDVLAPHDPQGDVVIMGGVAYRFYPGTGWVVA